MFEWWDTHVSIALVVVLLIVRFIGQPLWNLYVGWHLRIRHHVWCLPLFAVTGLAIGLITLFAGQSRLGEVFVIAIVSTGGLFYLLVGARCPECNLRIRYLPNRYGPVSYHCRKCGYKWTGWPLKDSMPD